MQKLFIFIIVSIISITALVVAINPVMHKQVSIHDSNYIFVDTSNNQAAPVKTTVVTPSVQQTSVAPQVINTQQTNIKPAQNIKTTSVKTTTQQIKPVNKRVKQQPVQVKNQSVKTTQAKAKQQTVKTTPIPTTTKEVKQVPAPKPQTKEVKPTPVKTVQAPAPTITKKKVLTESEEIIVWNKWRSDLQNQVMKDSKVTAPIGTQFKFSFTVDKYGNISNVNVYSTNPSYNDMAIKNIKPVLLSYKGKQILKFPEGTKRTITNVTGGFYISRTTGYSKPSDYSDYEKVKRTTSN